MLRHILTDKSNPLNWYERFKARRGAAEEPASDVAHVIHNFKTCDEKATKMISHHDGHRQDRGLLSLAKQDDLSYFREKHQFRHIPMEASQAAAIRKAGVSGGVEGAAAAVVEGEAPASAPSAEPASHPPASAEAVAHAANGDESSSGSEGEAPHSSSSSSSHPAPAARTPKHTPKPAQTKAKGGSGASASTDHEGGGAGGSLFQPAKTPVASKATLERLNALFTDPRVQFKQTKGIGAQQAATKFLFNGVPWDDVKEPATLGAMVDVLSKKAGAATTPDKDRIAGILRRVRAAKARVEAKEGSGGGGAKSDDA